ncbi:hypothetical protein [Herbaspirillum sp. alder98]|uniref:hypothetical protein n=1 Tax=Herbaspirillum sp. alder98 TaxID=2913096 RepID=UPI001CD8FFE1|nr:hypothetical protein [Herbaspirillum sp. alder98]MCA1327155.1 hypothetical protein [Herbaspirillum sp. alder98]
MIAPKRILLLVIAIVLLASLCKGAISVANEDVVKKLPENLFASEPFVEGQLNGVQIRVPANYMKGPHSFMVEYGDDHPWDASNSGEKRTSHSLGSPIVNLSVYVHQGDLAPLTAANYSSWVHSVEKGSGDDWVEFSYQGNLPEFSSWGMDNFLNRFYVNRKYVVSSSIRFEKVSGTFHGLVMEKTAPVDELKYDRNNYHYYYRRAGSRIATFIECRAGPPPVPGGSFICRHYFSMWPEAAVQGFIRYPVDKLSEWSDLEDKAKKIFLQFFVGCLPSAPACPLNKN